MNEVKFKTLNAEGVHRKLLAVAERLLCVEQIIDKVVNEVGSCHVLPVIGDASYELAEVYEDLQLNAHKEGPKKKSPLKILPSSKKRKKER